MTPPPSQHAGKSGSGFLRLVKNPVVLGLPILIYVSFALMGSSRTEPHGLEATASLHPPTSSDIKEEELPAATQWEPEQRLRRHSPGAINSNPVKGGVEVYPVQTSRRRRHVSPLITPEVDTIEGVYTAWKFPRGYDGDGERTFKGLYVVFHGCHHGPTDWFDLPEERAIVSYLLKLRYIVVAPGSSDRDSGCWSVDQGKDHQAVKAMLWKFYKEWSIPPEAPLFLFGASSGGKMATYLGRDGSFQLCDKASTRVAVSGILSQVSWGVKPNQFKRGCPPLAFMPMPKGDDGSGTGVEGVPAVFGQTRKVPPHLTAIAHNVRKAGGRPRMLLLPLGESPMYRHFFSDRIYEVTPCQSEELFDALMSADLLDCEEQMSEDESRCVLLEDPRGNPIALEALVSTYMAIQGGGGRRVDTEGNDADEDRGNMTQIHATEAFREELNVAWGAHELSGEYVGLWEPWLWQSCGDPCTIWSSLML